MSVTIDRPHPSALYWVRPLHAFLLAGTVPLFLGAMLSDIAYARSYQIQWNNFASWLLAGGLVVAGFALLCAVIDLFRSHYRGGRVGSYTAVLAITWIIGFINALVHAMDAWAIMPAALVLSVMVVVLAAVASWLGFRGLRVGGEQ